MTALCAWNSTGCTRCRLAGRRFSARRFFASSAALKLKRISPPTAGGEMLPFPCSYIDGDRIPARKVLNNIIAIRDFGAKLVVSLSNA